MREILTNDISNLGNDLDMDKYLMQGVIARRFVNSSGSRSVGKTHAVMKMAKKYKLAVLVKNVAEENRLKKEWDYDNIFSYKTVKIKQELHKKTFLADSLFVKELMELPEDLDILGGFVHL